MEFKGSERMIFGNFFKTQGVDTIKVQIILI